MKLPPLKTLPVFEAVARTLSFSAAAEELHVTQSAVSHRIRQLEDDLGESLFDRHGRRVALTEEGERYLEAIAPALAQIERASQQLRGQSDTRLRLAVPSSLAVRWLIPRLPHLQRRHPDLDLTLEMLADMPVMSERLADAFITIRYRQRGYVSTPLYVERLFAVCSRQYWMQMRESLEDAGLREKGSGRSIRPEWLSRFTLLSAASVFEKPGEDWRRWFQAAETEMPPTARVQQFSHMLLAQEAARHHQGIALSNDYMLDTASDPELVRLRTHEFRTGDEFHFACKQSRAKEPGILHLSRWLERQAEASGWR
ncbi:LysR family transcriptional regulator [Wenzhouxiangella marina]|uniref:LysR family transcriptional regulator n=1 Tax=Wenzhouxiangella marina TaxID=1579979 RepID=A0A0K0Y0L0_9GAMM|nr:LysR family transcriptional regulator [Wenzhouxiangella marina]AKS43411.1 LysR family transcriptional regulator [Wenzhouxiangella marina]MBB6088295.1 DNA-binding transcriptional LysR family regulator [Wenzhouxiangella marina]